MTFILACRSLAIAVDVRGYDKVLPVDKLVLRSMAFDYR